MELPDTILNEVVKTTEKLFCDYERKSELSDDDIIKETSDLYEGKKVLIISSNSRIEEILKESKKPWIYHYSLNLNWVVFFNKLYRKMWVYEYTKEGDDLEEIYLKTWRLELIFNHVDGIIESDDIIYLIKDDFKLIQKDIKRFTLN